MKIFYTLLLSVLFLSCSEERECSFATLEDAVNCACAISDEKSTAKEDKDIISELKSQTKLLNDQFDQAIKDSVFSEKEFIQQLKVNCESFNE